MTVSKPQRSPRSTRRGVRAALTAVPVVALFALSACSGGGSSAAGGSTAASAGAFPAQGDGASIVVIGGGGDPFFSTVQRGVDAAKASIEAAGGSVTYLALKDYSNLGPDTAQLTRTAISQKPAGIAVPVWVADAQNPAIKEAVDAGIEVMLYNAGDEQQAEDLGAMTYIGTDDKLAGVAAGKTLAEGGAKNAVCVNTVPGSANNESRCAGVKEGMEAAGGTASTLNLPSSSFGNQTAVTQAIKSQILQDPSIDGAVTISVVDSESAVAAAQQAGAGDKVKLVSFDVASSVLDNVKSGAQYAVIDQQPYAQGFYATSALFQKVAYGIDLPTKPILTGPLVITSENVDQAIAGAAAGTR